MKTTRPELKYARTDCSVCPSLHSFHPSPHLLIVLLCAVATIAPARTLTWIHYGLTRDWSEAANWSPAYTPATGDTLVFPPNSSSTNDLVNLELTSIQFTGNGGTPLRGNPLLVDSDVTASQNNGEARIYFNLTFAKGGGAIYTLGTGRLNIEGNIVGSRQSPLIFYTLYTNSIGTNLIVQGSIQGDLSLEKLGPGDAYLEGNQPNTYSGHTYVRGGTLHLGKNGVPAISSRVIIGDQSPTLTVLKDEGPGQYPAAMDVTVGSYGHWTLNNPATVTNLTLIPVEPSGYVSGGGSIDGSGFLSLACDVTVSNAPFFGGYNVGGSIDCPVLLANQTRTFYVQENRDTNLVQNYFTLETIVGTGYSGIIKDGPGYMSIEGPCDYAGPTLIKHGRLGIYNNDALGANTGTEAGTTVYPYAELFMYDVTNAESIVLSNASIGFSGANVLNGPLTLNGSCGFVTSIPIWGGYISNSLLEINGVVSGSVSNTYVGQGTVRFGGSTPNTFTGDVWVDSFVYEDYDHFVPYSTATLELAKVGNVTAVPGTVHLLGVNGPGVATLRNLQNDGAGGVEIDSPNSRWLLKGYRAAPGSLVFRGGGWVDSQGGQLELSGAPGTNRLYAFPSTNVYYPSSNYTAHIFGTLACLGPTNDLVIAHGLTLSIAAQITGTQTIRKEGSGTLDLSGNNTFTGRLLVDDGLLIDDSNPALNSTSAGTVVSNGATLLLNGTNITSCSSRLTLEGDGIGGTNGALSCYLNPMTTGNINLNGPATINTPNNAFLTVQSTISGTGPLSKTGLGTLQLGGPAANTYSGDTKVDEGELRLAKNDGYAAVPGSLIIGTYTGFGPPGRAGTVTHLQSDQITGTNVTVNGGSLYDLNGYNQSLYGVVLNSGGSIHTGTGLLKLYGPAGTRIAVNPGRSGASVISGQVQILFGGPISVGTQLLPNVLHPAPSLDLQATLSDAFPADLIKTGGGELRLSANNTFKAALQIDGGWVTAAAPGALGSSSGGTIVNNDARLVLDGGGLLIDNEPLTLDSTASPALLCASGSNTWSGPITLGRTADIAVSPANGYLQALNTVSGPGGLTKSGPGTVQFWGFAANTYGGLTTVADGTLEAGRVNLISIPGNAVIGDDSTNVATATLQVDREQQINPAADVTVHHSGYLHLYDFPNVPPPNLQLHSVTGSGQLRIDSQAFLTLSNDAPFTFDGSLSGGSLTANLSFVKRGSGTMKLSSESDGMDFVGRGAVMEGVLQVDGQFPTLAMHVAPNARLTGGGRVNSAVVEDQAVLAVDSASPGRQGGIFEVGSLHATNGSTLELNFYGPDPTGGNDQIDIIAAALSNATLSAAFDYPPREGDVLTLIRNGLSTPVKGMFNGWPQDSVHNIDGIPCRISYAGGGGSDVTLTVTNLSLSYFSYALAEGDGNQTVEPDECNLLYVTLLNRRTNPVIITNAVLRATSSNALVTIASAAYPPIQADSTAANLTPFQFRTDPSMACGDPVSFELVLGVADEGEFAVDFSPVSGGDCGHPTGPCESCTVVTGQFTTNTPTTLQPLYFVGGPSICYPPKACPGVDPRTNLWPVPYLVHTFTNSTTNNLCLTAQLDFDSPTAPTNALGVAAFLGEFDTNDPCAGYLGDSGEGGPPYSPFSFQVPAGSNFVVVVMAHSTNLVGATYNLELFGLPCPPPVLAITHEASPGKVGVDWSTAYPGWMAQQAGRLNGSFSNVTQTPAIVSGRYALTNLTVDTNRFYRLSSP